MDFNISKPVSRSSQVSEDDVRQLKKVLNHLGLYMPYPKTGITGIPDAEMIAALKAFQEENDLKPTGEIKPGDDTEKGLRDAVLKHKGKYIWRTVGDNRVREEHAVLEGEEREFGEGLEPGDDVGCRCWADPAYQGPPDCRKKQEAFDKIKEKFADIDEKRKQAEAELRALINQKNALVGELQKSLGKEIAALIVGIPFDKLGVIGELLQGVLGNVLSSKILEDADKTAQELGRVRRQAEYKAGQLAILTANLNKLTDAYTEAQRALDECVSKHQN